MDLAGSRQPKKQYFPARPVFWVLFFVLLGFGLRLNQLSLQPLWGDEGWSLYFAGLRVPQLVALTASDIHPPLYYLLLKLWLAITGTGADTARFFSVATGILLIPVGYALGQRLFGPRVGLVATGLISFMPMAIYYAQEVRMYGLITLLGAASTYFLVRWLERRRSVSRSSRRGRGSFYLGAYLLTATAALYTLYYTPVLIAAQGLYALVSTLAPRGAAGEPSPRLTWATRVRVLHPFWLVGLLYLPWIIYAAPRLLAYIDHKRAVEAYTSLGLFQFVADHLVAFNFGHLAPPLETYRWLVWLPLVIAGLGLLAAKSHRNELILIGLYLLLPLTAGYLINLLYPFTPRFYERTWMLAAPAYWLLLALGLTWLWDRQSFLAALTALLLVLAVGVCLAGFFSWPRYPHEDYRPLLRDIAARATPEDTILASYQWQVGLYQAYLPPPRPRLLAVPGWGAGWSSQTGGSPRLVADINGIFNRSPRLWFPAYQASGHIWEDEAEQAIAELGYPAQLLWYSPQTKLTLAGAARQSMQPAPVPANFGQRLTLLEAEVGGGVYQAGRDIVPVNLTWRKDKSLGQEHWVSLRLADEAGRTWTTRDSRPRANQIFFTELRPGDTLVDRHGLLTPAGAPPGRYRLLLSVRGTEAARPLDLLAENGQPVGAELLLAEIELIPPDPPVGAAALPVQQVIQAEFEDRVRLVGLTLGEGPYKAGEGLPLTLFWESLVDGPGPLTVLIEWQEPGGEVVFSHQQTLRWPSTAWRAGSLLRDPPDILLPPTFSPGEYNLTVSLLDPDARRLSVAGSDRLPLGAITTLDRPRSFDPPAPEIEQAVNFSNQAQLIGLDLPRTRLKAGEPLPLTLYWQALRTPDRSWTVFVHLIDAEGQIVAQQDHIPGDGQFPTTGWAPNEVLTDVYQIAIPAGTPPNKYHLRVGLYDANDPNFSRLPVVEGGQVVGKYVVLERWPISVE